MPTLDGGDSVTEDVEYALRVRPSQAALFVGLFAVGGVLGISAARGQSGFAAMAGLGLGLASGVVAIAALVAVLFVKPLPVRLTSAGLSAPRYAFTRQATLIPWTEVEGVHAFEMGGQLMLGVAGRKGQHVQIAAAMLPDRQSFDALHRAVQARAKAARLEGWTA
jgi:hypothetical protein